MHCECVLPLEYVTANGALLDLAIGFSEIGDCTPRRRAREEVLTLLIHQLITKVQVNPGKEREEFRDEPA